MFHSAFEDFVGGAPKVIDIQNIFHETAWAESQRAVAFPNLLHPVTQTIDEAVRSRDAKLNPE